MPFGQLPVLEVSGGSMKAPLSINQTHSILRYLAREFGEWLWATVIRASVRVVEWVGEPDINPQDQPV